MLWIFIILGIISGLFVYMSHKAWEKGNYALEYKLFKYGLILFYVAIIGIIVSLLFI